MALGAVVAEVAKLSMTASRRLQLAAERSGVIGIAVRRWRRQAEAGAFGQPTAAVTRWRVSALPSTPLPVPGIGRPRWRLELIRCRAGEGAEFEVEAPAMLRAIPLFLPTRFMDRVRRNFDVQSLSRAAKSLFGNRASMKPNLVMSLIR